MGRASDRELNRVAATFMTTLDAELARTLLDQHDIRSRLEGDLLTGAALPLQGAAGVRLLVTDDDAERAHDLIAKHEKELAAERRRTDTADERVARAYRLLFVGMLLLPPVPHLISLVNVLRVPWSSLSRKGRRHYVIALVGDLFVISAIGYGALQAFAS